MAPKTKTKPSAAPEEAQAVVEPPKAEGQPAEEATAAAASAAPAEDAEAAAKAAKRKEIEERVAALKLQRAKEEEQKTIYYGEHGGITCDGCGTVPIFGYRYRCKSCANHDVCESCFDNWTNGKMENGLGKQIISTNAADHSFSLFKDKSFKSMVKAAGDAKAAPKPPKPNEPCSCGSGMKFKKCCFKAGGS